MKVDRSRTVLKKMNQAEDSYVDALPEERVAFIWELTKELWGLKDKQSVERRLQRNVASLIKQQSNKRRLLWG